MKNASGNLRKMKVELKSPVDYHLIVGDKAIPLNHFLQKKIGLCFSGVINCVQCGRKTNKSFQQGFCFPCMQRINECGNCVIFPERCKVEEGGCPKDDWAHQQCYQKHIVYLANSSGLKVGITRHTHVPTRWIDQGAIQALAIFEASNRYQSGIMEVALKQYVSDRTNWRAMLKNECVELNLVQERNRLLSEAQQAIQKAMGQFSDGDIRAMEDASVINIDYPVLEYPEKIVSLSLDKQPEISGTLQGIKGQYLIFDTGVLNVRKFGGYEVTFKGG